MYYLFFIWICFSLYSVPPIIPGSKVNSLAGQEILRTTPDGKSWLIWTDGSRLQFATASIETSFSSPQLLHQGSVDSFNSCFDPKGNILCIYSAGSSLFYHYGDPFGGGLKVKSNAFFPAQLYTIHACNFATL